jgi:hypothetical protein
LRLTPALFVVAARRFRGYEQPEFGLEGQLES